MKKSRLDPLSIIASILLMFTALPLLALNIAVLVQLRTNPQRLPSLFGISMVVISSDSMKPLFTENDLVLIKSTEPKLIKTGDVICYLDGGRTVIHRVLELRQVSGRHCFVTKGDARLAADPSLIEAEQIQGKYAGHLVNAGAYVLFLQTPGGIFVFIALPLALLIVADIIARLNNSKSDRRNDRLPQADELASLDDRGGDES